MLTTVISIVHVAICIILVLIVLLQQGKGADMGATFGGSSNTLFGASGADTFLTKLTTMLAAAFMVTSVTLAIQSKHRAAPEAGRLFQATQEAPVETAPAATPENSTSSASPAGGLVVDEPAASGATAPAEAAKTATETSPAQK